MKTVRRQRKGVLRQAIDGYCKQCVYDSCDVGTWRQQVTLCTIEKCSLHHVRPLSSNAMTLLKGDFGHHQIACK